MDTIINYKPLNGPPNKQNSHPVKIQFGNFAIATTLLPLLGFLFCVFWSLIFHFKASTATHCMVANYLPSLSSAIGAFSPQKYVWRMAVGLHSAPRYLVAFMYYSKHRSKLILVLNLIEISSLVGLSFVSSTENYPIHANFFVTFMTTAITAMFILSYSSYIKPNRLSTKLKQYLAWTNLVGGALSVYFFARHNWFCEHGMYTLFAFSEYVVVLSNIAFHFQAFYDFPDYSISIASD